MTETDNAAAPKLAAAPKPGAASKRRQAPSPLGVITGGLGLFLVVLTLLAIQVRSGHDPSLGPGIVPPAISQPGTTTAGTTGPAQQATSIVTRTSPVPPP
ncbi:MAG TPA: hypothetical protein VIJ21_09240 [Solirubrobacterales bacterium]